MISSQARSRCNSDLPPILTLLLVHWQIICRDRISLRLYHRAGSCRLRPPGQAGTNHYGRPTKAKARRRKSSRLRKRSQSTAARRRQPAVKRGKRGREEWKAKIVDGVLCRRAAAQKQRSRVKTEAATKSNLSRGEEGSR